MTQPVETVEIKLENHDENRNDATMRIRPNRTRLSQPTIKLNESCLKAVFKSMRDILFCFYQLYGTRNMPSFAAGQDAN